VLIYYFTVIYPAKSWFTILHTSVFKIPIRLKGVLCFECASGIFKIVRGLTMSLAKLADFANGL
jgi:hypothetical protein